MDVSYINAILYELWDPIEVKGLAPNDEYEAYAGQIVEIINRGGDRDEVLSFLDRSRIREMRLKSDRRQDIAVVDAIEAYRRSLLNVVP